MMMTIETLIREVETDFLLARGSVLGRDRHRTVAEARQVAMWLVRELGGRSYPELGRIFQRDHTTAISAVRRVAARYAGEPAYAARVRRIWARVSSDGMPSKVEFVPGEGMVLSA
jgi:chromosomal replication initiator protein